MKNFPKKLKHASKTPPPKPTVLDQTSDIGHRHLVEASRFRGLVEVTGHIKRVLKPVYMKSLVSECACGVYSTFGSSTSKYSLETPRTKGARVSRVSYMHGKWRLERLH